MISENIFAQYLIQLSLMLVIFFGMDAISKRKINIGRNVFICIFMSFCLMAMRLYEVSYTAQFLLLLPILTILIIASSCLFKEKH